MRILHICGHKQSISSLAIFRPAIYGAWSSGSVSHCESDPTTYAIENIGLIILKRPLRDIPSTLEPIRDTICIGEVVYPQLVNIPPPPTIVWGARRGRPRSSSLPHPSPRLVYYQRSIHFADALTREASGSAGYPLDLATDSIY